MKLIEFITEACRIFESDGDDALRKFFRQEIKETDFIEAFKALGNHKFINQQISQKGLNNLNADEAKQATILNSLIPFLREKGELTEIISAITQLNYEAPQGVTHVGILERISERQKWGAFRDFLHRVLITVELLDLEPEFFSKFKSEEEVRFSASTTIPAVQQTQSHYTSDNNNHSANHVVSLQDQINLLRAMLEKQQGEIQELKKEVAQLRQEKQEASTHMPYKSTLY